MYSAPVDVRLAPDTVAVPDLFVIAASRQAIVGAQFVDGAPDLVIEVLSPSTAHLDRGERLDAYRAAGVREHWLVDAEAATLEQRGGDGTGELARVATLRAGDALDCTAFAGLVFAVAELLGAAR